jgi:hypothetical protein
MENNLDTRVSLGSRCRRIPRRSEKKVLPVRTIKVKRFNSTKYDNERKFIEFIQDKSHRVNERKESRAIPLGFTNFPYPLQKRSFHFLPNVFKANTTFGEMYCLSYEVTVGKEFIFEKGIYQDFYKHFQINLSNVEGLDLVKEFNLFISSHLIPTGNKPGRPKILKDNSTGEIKNIKPENKIIIGLWEEGLGYEAIRFQIHPKTKMCATKKTQIDKIKRKLNFYKDLLKRKV